MDDVKEALRLSIDALEIAADWGITDIQVKPPPEWQLEVYEENTEDG